MIDLAECACVVSERDAIENWFLLGSSITSPKTNEAMANCQVLVPSSQPVVIPFVALNYYVQVIPNHALKSLILEFREKPPEKSS